MKPLSLRSQIGLLAVLPVAIVGLALTVFFTHQRLTDAEQRLDQRGTQLANALALMSEFPLVTGDAEQMRRLLQSLRADGDIDFIQVIDEFDLVFAAQGQAPRSLPAIKRDGLVVHDAIDLRIFMLPVWQTPALFEDPFFDVDGQVPRRELGQVVLGLSTARLAQERRQMLRGGSLVSVALLVLIGVAAWRYGHSLARPLHALNETVGQLRQGQLTARAARDRSGEIAELQAGVNAMAAALAAAQADLQVRIAQATADVVRQKQEAEQANADKSRFLAAVSHDLRQPMQALVLFAATLRGQLARSENIELVGRIEDSIDALESMFNRLLDLSRLEAGIVEAHPNPLALQPLLDRVAAEWGPQAAKKGLRLRLRAANLGARSDTILLTRIVNNLVKNAIRYTERGGVLISCRRRGDRVLLQVWDSGSGITAAMRDRLYDEFYRGGTRPRDDGGLGLGLFLVKRFCDLLGHELNLRSQPGRGSVFSLGLAMAPLPDTADRAVIDDGDSLPSVDGQWLLLLEDDAAARAAGLALLGNWGLRTLGAGDLDDAMRLVADHGRPTLIVSDYRLAGGEDGIAAVTRLRAHCGATIPAILMSGDTSASGIAALNASGLPYLQKPVRPAKLRAMLKQHLPVPGDPDASGTPVG